MRISLLLLVSLISFNVLAVTIEFPEEELARESVLPVFDNRVAVKSRLVPTAKRFEFGVGVGNALNEPFFNTNRFGGHMAYHFTETHGILLNGMVYGGGLGNNGKALAATDLAAESATSDTFIRLEFAPQPKYQFFANYQVTPYYGKISIFKNFVMNLSLYGFMGVGAVDIGGETTPAFNIGMGQKFYFSKYWGIRADLGFMAYRGVDFFNPAGGGEGSPLQDTVDPSNSVGSSQVTRDVPVSEFARQMNYDLYFSLALIILL